MEISTRLSSSLCAGGVNDVHLCERFTFYVEPLCVQGKRSAACCCNSANCRAYARVGLINDSATIDSIVASSLCAGGFNGICQIAHLSESRFYVSVELIFFPTCWKNPPKSVLRECGVNAADRFFQIDLEVGHTRAQAKRFDLNLERTANRRASTRAGETNYE